MKHQIELLHNWKILQDVHDTAEQLGLPRGEANQISIGAQLSEWEDLPQLKQLQLLYADNPYFGRELRYFNEAPWWYEDRFEAPAGKHCYVRFTNVDYYCKVWLNGEFLGEHEGYSAPFSFCGDKQFHPGQINVLTVKVWAPWDNDVDGGRQENRTSLILRRMVKGTYEHSDTFIQRDVNPVGIYGSVTVEITDGASFAARPELTYELNQDRTSAAVHARAALVHTGNAPHTLRLSCIDKLTGEQYFAAETPASADGAFDVSGEAAGIRLWNTWDHGQPWLYRMIVTLCGPDGEPLDTWEERTGFRTIEMIRNESQTMFLLNGKRLYVRGTSYFPDVYVSAMNRERYKRDLLSIRSCGFNLVRVHVHVEQEIFYELCSELGIAVIQDSEYNWAHPADDAFAERFISVYLQTVDMLKQHPSLIGWICMNEPGLLDENAEVPASRSQSRSMTVNPGPKLYRAVREHDPSRPVIKGSSCEDDPDSGDSHNYTGSLSGDIVHYSEIFDSSEKFNTEYGFDAPPCTDSLRKCPTLYQRLSGIEDRFPEIGHYQYALLKYYTEHYRMQKYRPNAGYVQFLFNDIGPNSFYGLFDWWGLPKEGLDAMLESNMPIGIFLKYKEMLDSIYAVNDLPTAVGDCIAKWVFTDGKGNILSRGERAISLDADAIVKVCALEEDFSAEARVDAALLLMRGEELLCSNHYADLFHMPEHVKGHPSRMSHETGMRLYFS